MWSLWFPFSDTLTQKLNVFFGVWWKMTHLPDFCCLSLHKHLFLLLLRGSGAFGFESLRSFIPFPCFPAPLLPFLLVQIGIQHRLSRLIWLFFFLFSLSNLYLPVWFFQSLISCPLSSNSSLFPALLWHIFIPTVFFFSFHLSMMFSIFSQWNPPLVIFSFHTHIFLHSHINNDNNNDNFISFFFLLFFLYLVWTPPLQILPSLIEWPLSCDHLFPLPLLFSFPSLYLARRTSFPPWVQQTPVWKLKVEGEALEER